MNTYRVYVNGLEYETEASSVPVAISRTIKHAYLKGVDIKSKSDEEIAYFLKNRRRFLNRINNPARHDESSFNVRVHVKRIA